MPQRTLIVVAVYFGFIAKGQQTLEVQLHLIIIHDITASNIRNDLFRYFKADALIGSNGVGIVFIDGEKDLIQIVRLG